MSAETVETERGKALEKQLLIIIGKFTDEERGRIFELIGEHFCLHCGIAYTERHQICHCRNDE
jgi:hypothetical protein